MAAEDHSAKTLQDIAHYFLSNDDAGPQKAEESRQATVVSERARVITFLDSDEDCAFRLHADLAEKLSQNVEDIAVLDFHADRLEKRNYSTDPSHGAVTVSYCDPESIGLDSLERVMKGKNLVFAEMPWRHERVVRYLLSLVDQCVFIVQPSLASFKKAYRRMKGVAPLLRDMPRFALRETDGLGAHERLKDPWVNFVRQLSGVHIQWVKGDDLFGTCMDCLESLPKQVSFSPPPMADASLRDLQGLDEEELKAFFDFACSFHPID